MKMLRVEMDFEQRSLVVYFDTAESLQLAYNRLQAETKADQKAELDAKLLQLYRSGYKIEAIKAHRAATGSHLIDAKKYVEALAEQAGA